MTIFDLLFLLAVLAVAVSLATAAVLAISGRRSAALRLLAVVAICAAVYLVTGLTVSLLRPQRILRAGEAWCFDDWCLEVEHVTRVAAPPMAAYTVQFRMFSRARRVAQSARGAWIYLIDDHGHRYSPDPDPMTVPLDVKLQPLEAVTTSRTFRVPAKVHSLGLITGHGGAYCGAMDFVIIGDGGCVFNKPAMIRVQ